MGPRYSPLADWGYGSGEQGRANYIKANGYDYYSGRGSEHCFNHGADRFYGHEGYGGRGALFGAISGLVQEGARALGWGGSQQYGAPPYGNYSPPPAYPQPQADPGYHAAYPQNPEQQGTREPVVPGTVPDASPTASPPAQPAERAKPPAMRHAEPGPFGRLLHASNNCGEQASKGEDVSKAAVMLQNLGYGDLSETIKTGDFGPKDGPMDKAVHQFQEKHNGMEQDGIIGPKTGPALISEYQKSKGRHQTGQLDGMTSSLAMIDGNLPTTQSQQVAENKGHSALATPSVKMANLNIGIG